MRTTQAGLLAGTLLLIAAAGCAPIPAVVATPAATVQTSIEPTAPPPTATPTPVDAPTSTPPVEETPMNKPSPAPLIEPGIEPLIQLAVDDLTRRLGISPEEIAVIEARSVVWPDASIGCPHPDMQYIQVPEDGAFIRLSAGGRLYNYHNGGRRGLFLCEKPGKSVPPPTLDGLQLPGGGGEDL